ncbi:ABC transporter ATP-binding protein [Roseomonas sp. E05]|uniref:ABC transporter ATP-binding protein n=1 Tax=Roseomonas sp. E05 TaxID=3046310 RepID=UPI0024B8C0CD|nr:ABC transporter ATP-binding protein [Roseomonas sp. E05]MDJ0387000.1 ABC transporter ATP-binding protein [Roseomonas sp. E05]
MGDLVLEALTKRYGGTVAVEDVDLEVRQGEMVALLGPSGCGKTTTLRMVAGFITPSAGHVRIAGQDVTRRPPYARDTGMVFQSYALFPHMSVAQNVAFGLEMRRVGRTERETRVMEALRLVRLDHLADRLPGQLSGGQQQRVALARALVVNPAVFLLDEPLSNLDAKLRGEVRMEIRSLQQRLGLTTLIVTHDQEEALTMADRLVVMERGRVRQVGTAEELYESPRDPFVAGFVGRCNLIEGQPEGTAGFRARGGALLPCTTAAAPVGTGGVLALRPERIALAAAAPGEGAARLEAVTYLGAQTEYVVDYAGTSLVVIRATPPEGDPLRRLAPGDAVALTWDPAAARLLPAQ